MIVSNKHFFTLEAAILLFCPSLHLLSSQHMLRRMFLFATTSNLLHGPTHFEEFKFIILYVLHH